MNHELNEKLRLEQPLTLEESLQLDSILEESNGMSAWLNPNAAESPSLAWRSQLNEKLLAHAPKPKRTFRLGRVPQLATLAATIAFATFSATSFMASKAASAPAPGAAMSPEELMISAHLQNNFSAVVPVPTDTPLTGQEATGSIHWSPEELSTY